MNKSIAVALVTHIAVVGYAAPAELPTGYSQVFACTLKQGKTIENVWAATDRFKQHVATMKSVKADPNFAAFLWTPFRGALPYDFIWGVTSSDLVKMGDGMTEYYASQAGLSIDQQFYDNADCISAIVSSTQLNVGKIGNKADRMPDAVVDAYQCNISDGSDMEDVDSALEYWTEQIAAIKSEATGSYQAWKWTPFLGGSGTWDWMFVGASPDIGTYMKGYSDYYNAKQGQAAQKRMDATGSCLNSIWMGYWVVVPATEQ